MVFAVKLLRWRIVLWSLCLALTGKTGKIGKTGSAAILSSFVLFTGFALVLFCTFAFVIFLL